MSIDIHFLQNLPESFLDNNQEGDDPGFFQILRRADTNHDFSLSPEEIRSALPSDIQGERYQRSVEDMERTSAFIRETLRSGQVDLRGIRRDVQLFVPRDPAGSGVQTSDGTRYTWGHPHIDSDRNLIINRSEILSNIRNSLPTRGELLRNYLFNTAEGLYRTETASRHRGLMNLSNIATWIPMHIIPGVADNLHDQIRIRAHERHEVRMQAINRFMEHLNTHPAASVQDALEALSGEDQSVLIEDLQVQNWQYVLSSANPEEMVDAHVRMAEYFMQGAYSNYGIGGGAGRSVFDFFVVPWHSENYAMAHNIVVALERMPNLSPAQQAQVADLRRRISQPNQLIIQSLPPANNRAQEVFNNMVRGALDLIELPRPDSLNETWDFMATAVVELLLLKGSLRALKWARPLLATRLAASGGAGTWIASRFLGYAAPVTGLATAAAATCSSGVCAEASNRASVSTPILQNLAQALSSSNITNTCAPIIARINQVSPSLARRLMGIVTGGASKAMAAANAVAQVITVGVGGSMVQSLVIPPERHNTQTDVFLMAAPDTENAWVNANLVSLALAIYQTEHPLGS